MKAEKNSKLVLPFLPLPNIEVLGLKERPKMKALIIRPSIYFNSPAGITNKK